MPETLTVNPAKPFLCKADGCTELCPTRHFFCKRHWNVVPAQIRSRIQRGFANRGAATGSHAPYFDAVNEAKVAVRAIEGAISC